jgi:hypothetical protein
MESIITVVHLCVSVSRPVGDRWRGFWKPGLGRLQRSIAWDVESGVGVVFACGLRATAVEGLTIAN